MKVSGAAKRERRERKGCRRAAKIVFILKAKWKEKLSTVNNCRGGGGREEKEEGVAKGTGVLADKRNVVSLGQRNRHFKIRRSYAHQILPSVI